MFHYQSGPLTECFLLAGTLVVAGILRKWPRGGFLCVAVGDTIWSLAGLLFGDDLTRYFLSPAFALLAALSWWLWWRHRVSATRKA